MDTRLAFAAAAVAATAFAGQSSATYCYPQSSNDCKVIGSAYGSDSYECDTFWGIDFKSGCDTGFIQSVTLDLQAGSDSDAYFDLSGPGSSGPDIGSLNGISAGDVTFTPDSGDTSTLTLNFAAGSFGVGDSIRFGADTDNLRNNSGGDVGRRSVGFTVTFENGSSYSTSFNKITRKWSYAKIKADDCCGTAVPTPGAAGLGLLMLAGLGARRRRSA